MNSGLSGNGWASAIGLAEGEAEKLRVDEFEEPDEAEEGEDAAAFDNPSLIVRRGATMRFTVAVTLPEGEDPSILASNALVLSDKKGFGSVLIFQAADESGPEACATLSHSAEALELEVQLPDEMPVGEYRLNVVFGGRSWDNVALAEPERLLVLFNAWSPHGDEHLPDEAACDEYVTMEEGIAHYGTWRRPGRMAWNYGQHEPGVLAAACKILSGLRESDRSSPVSVCRAVTRAINHQGAQDAGVLSGDWSGDYQGEGERPEDPEAVWTSAEGKDHPANAQKPTHWNGSVEILSRWAKDGKPVAYGQCWVFAGITTSLLRCLGIGARQVTNFRSAHDTNGNRMIEQYYDEEGNKVCSCLSSLHTCAKPCAPLIRAPPPPCRRTSRPTRSGTSTSGTKPTWLGRTCRSR
eukprot:COSAG04_NODE_277_length_18399_cov_3.036066_3_plen_409_part_00